MSQDKGESMRRSRHTYHVALGLVLLLSFVLAGGILAACGSSSDGAAAKAARSPSVSTPP